MTELTNQSDQNETSDYDKLNQLIKTALCNLEEVSELALQLKAMQVPKKKIPWYKRLFGGK